MLYKGVNRYRNFQCYLFLSPLYHSIQWNVLLWHKYTAQRSSHWSWNVSNNNPYIPRINPQALTPSQEYITPDTNQGWIYPLKSSQLPSFKSLLPWGSYWMTNEHWPGFKVKELRTGQYSTLIFFAIFYNQILMIYPLHYISLSTTLLPLTLEHFTLMSGILISSPNQKMKLANTTFQNFIQCIKATFLKSSLKQSILFISLGKFS